MYSPEQLIAALDLVPHDMEGGFYIETWRSRVQVPQSALGPDYEGDRDAGTAIYYLLTPDTCSAMHRLPGDEVFHFYLGDPVEQVNLWPDGRTERVVLGTDVLEGMRPQHVVPAGVWQGARLRDGGRVALLGATMAPGFDFADYEAGDTAALGTAYPAERDFIARLAPAP